MAFAAARRAAVEHLGAERAPNSKIALEMPPFSSRMPPAVHGRFRQDG
jgi:hypothetical protein